MSHSSTGTTGIAVAIVIAIAVLAPRAGADQVREKVVVLDVSITGDAPKELRKSLVASLGGGLYSAGYAVIQPDKLKEALSTAPELDGCATPTCLETLAVMLGETRLFVRARITAAGAAYNIELEMLTPSAGSGGAIARIEQSCEVCSLPELNSTLSDAAVALRQRVAEQSSAADAVFRFTIKSEPPGASVMIDGLAAGTTMLSSDLPAGRHQVTLRYSGYKDAVRTIEVSRSGINELEVTLERAPPPPPPRRYRPHLTLGLVSIGAGLVGIGAGAYLLAIDGDGTCSRSDGGECKEVNATLLPGLVSLGAGAGLTGLGVYLITRTRLRQQAAAAAIAPTRGGWAVVVTGRF